MDRKCLSIEPLLRGHLSYKAVFFCVSMVTSSYRHDSVITTVGGYSLSYTLINLQLQPVNINIEYQVWVKCMTCIPTSTSTIGERHLDTLDVEGERILPALQEKILL